MRIVADLTRCVGAGQCVLTEPKLFDQSLDDGTVIVLDENPSPGGIDLGGLGPVSEGLFVWIFALGSIVAITVWLTAKSN